MAVIRFFDDVSEVIKTVALPKLTKKDKLEYCTYDDVRIEDSKITKTWNNDISKYDVHIGWKPLEEKEKYIVFIQAYWRTAGLGLPEDVVAQLKSDNICGIVLFSTFSDDCLEETCKFLQDKGIEVTEKLKIVGSPNERITAIKNVIGNCVGR